MKTADGGIEQKNMQNFPFKNNYFSECYSDPPVDPYKAIEYFILQTNI